MRPMFLFIVLGSLAFVMSGCYAIGQYSRADDKGMTFALIGIGFMIASLAATLAERNDGNQNPPVRARPRDNCQSKEPDS
ncbi:hypothetical protein ABZ897_46060 [Nonomuraea sp. NPDC046802]|uniref:hypothetical protein n=1 Tax=Nonomuraea sp. NPDC046802 TaxID=3154919 RepID=UPI0033CF7AFA